MNWIKETLSAVLEIIFNALSNGNCIDSTEEILLNEVEQEIKRRSQKGHSFS